MTRSPNASNTYAKSERSASNTKPTSKGNQPCTRSLDCRKSSELPALQEVPSIRVSKAEIFPSKSNLAPNQLDGLSKKLCNGWKQEFQQAGQVIPKSKDSAPLTYYGKKAYYINPLLARKRIPEERVPNFRD